MTEIIQTTRAGPGQASGPLYKPSPIDLGGSASFAAFLAQQIRRDADHKSEDLRPADRQEPAEKPDEPPRREKTAYDPADLLVLAQVIAPRAQPVEPPPDGEGGKKIDEQGGGAATAEKSGSAIAGSQASQDGKAAQGNHAAQSSDASQDGKQVEDKAADGKTTAAKSTDAGVQDAQKAPAGKVVLPVEDGQAVVPGAEVPAEALKDLKASGSATTKTAQDAMSGAKTGQVAPADPAAISPASESKAASAASLPNPAPGASPMAAAPAGNVAHQPGLIDLAVPAPARQAAPAADGSNLAAESIQTGKIAETAPAAVKAVDPGGGSGGIQNAGSGSSPSANAVQSFEPARLAEAQSKGMIWQVVQNVESMVKSRQTSLRLMLFPEELGRIDLRLTAGSNGMGVSLVAQQASTGQLLESHLEQLRQALDQAGIRLANLSVGQQGSGTGSGAAGGKRSQGKATSQARSARVETVTNDRMVKAGLEPSSGYDYLI